MDKQIILLNGPSSSGKSTLSKALQSLIKTNFGKQFDIISIDDFLKMSTSDTIYEDDVFAISHDMCQKVLDVLAHSPGVIIDHVITSERIFIQLQEMLLEHPIHKVLVTCPVDVLLERERTRKNRCIGSAAASREYLYPKTGYDITVDTYCHNPEECAVMICRSLLKI